ncbi:uncharacterized protein K02A2.6-like [Nematostella vectensis]|uniref:uncharacterized protein K02A2.6-like n=1 Tax=Nematostella vectensis TaxID=45351 RepID=UPI0020772FD2|nr:uncharacterized protein K02A2.6-like [Nematostella vectensis]
MASGYVLPPPAPLEIHNSNAADKWKRFVLAWKNYSLATGLNEKVEAVQVATLLTVIGEEAREVYSTFTLTEGETDKIEPVIKKFAEYCQPRKNVPFERFRFNQRMQEPGESYEHYRTALRKLAESCEFDTITPDEILRDRLLFGIHDTKVRERLLRESKLTLAKTDEICRAAESMLAQMKIVKDTSETDVNAVSKFESKKPNIKNYRRKQRGQGKQCDNCGYQHMANQESCPARGKDCRKCGAKNHFANRCKQEVKATEVEETDMYPEETYQTEEVLAVWLDDSQLVTFQSESGSFIRFQPDTGAQCNVLPVHLYKQACNDHKLVKVKPVQTSLVAYGGSKIKVVGHVTIRVWRNHVSCQLDCRLVDSHEIRPILGRKACLGMNIIQYNDNDQFHKPQTDGATVFTVDPKPGAALTREEILAKFPAVFSDGVGKLDGEYTIRLDTNAQPVQHAPRRVAVALRPQLKKTLNDLVDKEIIAPVTTPTSWISSMVVVPKKDGKLRICLDPKDLNKAIQRENYPLPTIEEVATRLHGAKVFTLLDVRNGFWHVQLEEESTYLTTFHTPFGRYRWKRMPFGISSAPEVFQRKMHEFAEGLTGTEVVADDFLVVGYGESYEEATADHDRNLLAFLNRCDQRDIHLNPDKMRLRKSELLFIGHIATDKGLKVDPAKVRAIVDMPSPTDKLGVQRLLGLAQYLAKFLPQLSDITKPLRDLTQSDVQFIWDDVQQSAFEKLKDAVTVTPVLRYYNLDEEITLQCDASQSGLGAALLQNGQPVAYASRALTPAETRYAQIEKELLAIVFACDRFHTYVYGREVVNIETDHKPLEPIFIKPLATAPKRLQRMLLSLQSYSLNVKYKKGKDLYLADTLSRAYLPEVNAWECTRELEEIDHRSWMPVREETWQQLKNAAVDDAVQQNLREVIKRGWPESKTDLPECVHPYFDIRDELTVQEELIFKGQQLVVPRALRKELMEKTHSSHIGIEGCIRRARDTFFWPRMTVELKEYITKCEVCLTHRSGQRKEPILQHEFVARPWGKVSADLCELDNRTLLVVSDYFSNYIEVAQLNTVTSRAIIKELKAIFARFGIPDTLITDNGPQFASAEFSVFAKTWMFEHKTSSPRYAQANGKAENAVQTVKRLFKKCKTSGGSEFQALLDWRNTPTAGIGTSPAQRLFGRRCKTLLPVAGSLLQPSYNTEEDTRKLIGTKQRQKFYYDKHSKPLEPIAVGETVRMKLPGQDTWTPGTCLGQAGPRSYNVETEGTTYRRNRRQLISTGETNSQVPDVLESPEPDDAQQQPSQVAMPPDSSQAITRPWREVKPPAWLKDYVPK